MKNAAFLLLFLLAAAMFAQGQTLLVTDDPGFTGGVAVMNATGNTLGVYRLANNADEDVRITSVVVLDSTTAIGSFTDLVLFVNGTVAAMAGSAEPGPLYKRGLLYRFHLPIPLVVPRKAAVTITIRGDVPPYASGGAEDNSVHRFQIIDPAMVTVVGTYSNRQMDVATFAYGSDVRVLRSNLIVSVNPDGAMALFASPSGPVVLNKLTVTFTTWSPVLLLDANGNDVVAMGEATALASRNTITWYFIRGLTIQAGTTTALRLHLPCWWVRATIEKPTDVTFTDGVDDAAIAGVAAAGHFPIVVGRYSITTGTSRE